MMLKMTFAWLSSTKYSVNKQGYDKNIYMKLHAKQWQNYMTKEYTETCK